MGFSHVFACFLASRLYQILFSKQLNRNQWMAIALITVGCMCKESEKVTTLGFQARLGMPRPLL